MPNQRDWTDPAGVPVKIIGNGIPARWRDHAFALGVASHIVRHRSDIDMVYFLMQGLHLATGLLACRMLNIPAVMKFSGSNLITTMTKSPIGRLELRWLQQWARSVMVLNDGMVDEAVAAGFSREQLLWMPNPVDVSEFAPAGAREKVGLRQRLGLPGDAAVVMFVGRLAPEKQLQSLIRGFAGAAAQRPEALLVLVGDGPERPSLERMARDLGIDSRVRFTGRVNAADIPVWLKAADTFALVSSLEGFPCSLVEAMSVALPSVVSDIPANRQLIDSGVNGVTAPVGDANAIASALVEVLRDEEFRAKAGTAARRLVVENFSTSKVAARYERLFENVLRG
jgi:glycosyltransferase involved in cell wall biosynthesis